MNLHPLTFGGTSVEPTGCTAYASGDSFYNQAPVNPMYSNIANSYPRYATRVIQPRDLVIMIQMASATAHTLVDTLNAIFDATKGEQTLIVEDTDNSNKQWYMNCSVARPPRIQGAVYTVTLRAAVGIWRSVTVHSDATWNPTSSGDTHALTWTQAGNIPAQPTITLTPQGAKGSGAGYYRYILMTNPLDVALDDWWELTDGGLDTAAIVTAGHAQADGDDFLVFVDAVERDRRFGTSTHAFDAAATYVQARVPLRPRIELTLGTAIAGTGSITEIVFEKTRDNRTFFKDLPDAGQMMIGSEAFTWTSKNSKALQLEGTITRAAFDTSMGAHSVGDTCKWVEHIIQLQYGDSAATAPSFDSTREPMWDSDSTNLSRVYTSMTDSAGLRPGRWTGDIGRPRSKGRGGTRLYTAAANTDADPATVLGIYAESWLSGSRYQDESIDATWDLYVPQGVTTVTATGHKRYTSSTWPAYTFEVSTNGKRWTTIWTEAAPSGSTDEAWSTHSAVSLGGTYYYLRFHMKGSVPAGSGYYAYSELSDITLTLASKATITLEAENGSAYPLDVTLNNTTNGDTISVTRMIEVGQSLQIMLGPQTRQTVYLADNSTGPRLEFPDTQDAPFTLDPGSNTLEIIETGLTDMDITVTAEDWNL